ncbi:endolytic transglycosylase MltG [Patescibacteria group bacterium]|nr:endolytic transglycosylase MltG [Patescibacteria group bacterium]
MRKLVFTIIIIIVILFLYYLYVVGSPYSKVSEVEEFIVHPGWGSMKIAEQLEKQGFIKSNQVFVLYVWKNGISSKLMSGEYDLAKNLSIKEVAQVLSGGLVKDKERAITIIEGWDTRDIAYYFEQEGVYNADDLYKLVGEPGQTYEVGEDVGLYDFSEHYDFLFDKPKDQGLEGYLFPDTYRIYHDAELITVVKKMLDNFEQKLTTEMKEQIKINNVNIHDTLTLASIIEKEVATDEDRKLVASVFYKRLNNDMPLQADSTINFFTQTGKTRSSIEETKIDNPYNTYKYIGLPPGPICNPSLSSIMAAIYPDKNSYYYFLTEEDGTVHYASNLEGHAANRAKYLD